MCRPDSEVVQPDTSRPRPRALRVNRIWRNIRSVVVGTRRKGLLELTHRRTWLTPVALVVEEAVVAPQAEPRVEHPVVRPAAAVEVAVAEAAPEELRVERLLNNSQNSRTTGTADFCCPLFCGPL